MNDLPEADKKIWTNHVHHTPQISFNAETFEKALITATLPKEETGETNSYFIMAKSLISYHD